MNKIITVLFGQMDERMYPFSSVFACAAFWSLNNDALTMYNGYIYKDNIMTNSSNRMNRKYNPKIRSFIICHSKITFIAPNYFVVQFSLYFWNNTHSNLLHSDSLNAFPSSLSLFLTMRL